MSLKVASIFFILLVMAVVQSARAWEVDFSRRQKHPAPSDSSVPQTVNVDSQNVVGANPVAANSEGEVPRSLPPHRSRLKDLVAPSKALVVDRQEVVILNTDHGFVPASVRLHKGLHYRFHVVNVNESKRNVSFMLDAFDQHHATYFGEIKTFDVDPDKAGVFEFQCPETSAEGKVVVFGVAPGSGSRALSSEE